MFPSRVQSPPRRPSGALGGLWPMRTQERASRGLKNSRRPRTAEARMASRDVRFGRGNPGRVLRSRDQHFDDTQSWNIYSYVRNQPTMQIDPDGQDALAIVFPDYKIQTPVGKIGGLGHAAVVTFDSKGKTRYFEYGRYDAAGKGLVQERGVPSLVMGKDGKPTQESMNAMMKTISNDAGHGGKVEAAQFKANDEQTQKMTQYAEGREAQNSDPNRTPYDLTKNNCATFMDATVQAGGVKLPSDLSAKPTGQIGPLQNAAQGKVSYDPAKVQETKKKKEN